MSMIILIIFLPSIVDGFFFDIERVYIVVRTADFSGSYTKTNIVIKEENKDRIEKILNEVQKLCRVRLITYNEMYDFLEKLRKLYPISNKNLNGCVFEIDLNAQTFPSAYKYTPESTQFEVIYKNGYFKLIAVYRYQTKGPKSKVEAKLTSEAEAAILKSFEKPYEYER